jgi:hypothetical protein
MIRFQFLCSTITFFLLHVGRPLRREDGYVICSAITHWLESRRIRNHTLLSHLRLLQLGGPGPRIYISLEQGNSTRIFYFLHKVGEQQRTWTNANVPGSANVSSKSELGRMRTFLEVQTCHRRANLAECERSWKCRHVIEERTKTSGYQTSAFVLQSVYPPQYKHFNTVSFLYTGIVRRISVTLERPDLTRGASDSTSTARIYKSISLHMHKNTMV